MFRIYYNGNIAIENIIQLSNQHAHYLIKVLRSKIKEEVILFNEKNGEFLSEIIFINSKKTEVKIIKKLRKITDNNNMKIAIPFLKPKRFSWFIEKITELNIKEIFILKSQYSQKYKINLERLKLIAIEAAEQSNRIDIPIIHDNIIELKDLLSLNINWIFGEIDNEIDSDFKEIKKCDGLIIGPEGGFSKEELILLKEKANGLFLSKNILRSETAAIAGLSIINNLKTLDF